MFKKLLFTIVFILIFAAPTHAAEDFSKMNPTVKITSYKKLFIDQVLAYGSGSGTVVSSDGIVITNHHVIFDEGEFKQLDAFEICITFNVAEEPVCKYTARLITHNKDLDIALLKINSKDIYGNSVPTLKYLSYKSDAAPKEQTRLQVVGYPGSGGETITITQGQISGFEEFNGYQYFKTDTDFDHGSSGGTAFDPDGNFIGIPTYIRSYAENVGYFLDLREAREWLDENIKKSPSADRKSEELLIRELARYETANADLKYTQKIYPDLQIALPTGWEFLEINDDSFFASQKNLSNPVGLAVFISLYQFEVNASYMKKLNEELEGIKDSYPDYKKEETMFAGQSAWKITYTSYANKNITYYIPYGYTLIGLSYSIDLNEVDKQEKAIAPVLSSIKFTKLPKSDPLLLPTLSFAEPPFEITAADDWRIQKNNDKSASSLLAEAVQDGNFDGDFSIYYRQISKDERHLTAAERLDEAVKNMGSRKLVYKNGEVLLGGLSGFLYTYEYEGSNFQEIKKHLAIKIRNGDYEFSIHYDDLAESFDKNLPGIQKMLDSFQFKGETTAEGAKSSYGNLAFTFTDIQYHRFAKSISNMAEKGIVQGYANGTFAPELLVNRVEALKIILESKNHLETEKGLGNEINFEQYKVRARNYLSDLWDVLPNEWYGKYLSYAIDKEIVKGYSNGSFKPTQSVTLAEALKMILNVYETPLWKGDTDPWYRKYMDKGFELGLIPYGFYDPAKPLTRAELTKLVDTIYRDASNDYF